MEKRSHFREAKSFATLDKKRTIIEIRGEKNACSTCDIMLDQRRESPDPRLS